MAVRLGDPVAGQRRHRRVAGAAAAAALAAVHADRLLVAAREAVYLGVLFAVATGGFGWVALRVLRADDVEAWWIGALLAAGVAGGYVLSCTIGLPGLRPTSWSPLGVASSTVAVTFLVTALGRSRMAHS